MKDPKFFVTIALCIFFSACSDFDKRKTAPQKGINLNQTLGTLSNLGGSNLIVPSALPAPIGLPPAPQFSVSPGGRGLPIFKSGADSSAAPAIGFSTDTAFQNETVAVMGQNLTGADFAVWSEGGVNFGVGALRSAEDRAQVVIPVKESYTNSQFPGPIPKSVMFLWPHNANGFGLPVRLNAPKLFWIWPGKMWTNNSDRRIRIFGKNLALPGYTPVISIQRGTSAPTLITIQSSPPPSANELTLDTYNFPAGDYKVQVSNGSGGQYGWSEVGTFTIKDNPYKTAANAFYVDLQTGSDQQRIDKAINLANEAGGGRVIFGARRYKVSAPFWGDRGNLNFIPAWPDANPKPKQSAIVLKGTVFNNQRTELVATSNPSESEPEVTFIITGAGSQVRDMKLTGIRVSVQAVDVTIDNVEMSGNDVLLSTYNFNANENINLNVTNSTFRSKNGGVGLFRASFIRFDRCHFFGSYNDGVYDRKGELLPPYNPQHPEYGQNLSNHGITLYGVHKLIIENSDFQSEDALNNKILTRGVAVLYPGDSHIVLSRNVFRNIGAFPGPSRDPNTGEVIMFHGIDTGLRVKVDSADMTSVTVERPLADFKNYEDTGDLQTRNDFGTYSISDGHRAVDMGLLQLIVVSGPAAGQVLKIKSHSGNSLTRFSVSPFQNIVPRPGDFVVVRPFYNENLILNNHIDPIPDSLQFPASRVDFGRTGISIYMSSHDTLISGNTIKHVREGIVVQSSHSGTWVQGSNQISENIIERGIAGGPGESYVKCYANFQGYNWYEPRLEFYSMGNIFRNNKCSFAQMGVALGEVDYDHMSYPRSGYQGSYQVSKYTGVMHSIVENNIFTNISGTPFGVTATANWALIRNNSVDVAETVNHFQPEYVHETHFVGRDATNLKQIDADSNVMCGVDQKGEIYCADQNIEFSPNWFKVYGNLRQIAVSGGQVMGINGGNVIYFAPDYRLPIWETISFPSAFGYLKQLDIGWTSYGRMACGVADSSAIYCTGTLMNPPPPKSPRFGPWFNVRGGLKHLSISQGHLLGVNDNDDIYYTESITPNPSWSLLGGKLKQVSLDGTTACGVNSYNQLYCSSGVPNSMEWIKHTSRLFNHATVTQNKAFGVTFGKSEILAFPPKSW